MPPKSRPLPSRWPSLWRTDPPRVLVSDGEILEGNLRALGRDRNWLNKQLKGAGCAGTEAVFLLLSNGSDPPYIVEKEGEP